MDRCSHILFAPSVAYEMACCQEGQRAADSRLRSGAIKGEIMMGLWKRSCWQIGLGIAGLVLTLTLALPAWCQNPEPSDSPDTSQPTEDNAEKSPDATATSDAATSDAVATASDIPDDPANGLPLDTNFGGPLGPNYVVGPEDVLTLTVFDVPELKDLLVRVANDGTISLPLLGRVKAAGLTTEQLRHELEEKWGEKYLQDPQVTIFIRQFRAKPVSVIGAVEKPGLYPLTAPRTLVEVLSMAGGLGKRATGSAGRTAYITRTGGFGDLKPTDGMQLVAPDKLEVDLHRLLYSKDDTLNVPIKPLDVISVTKAPVVYVVGEVKKAGGFMLEDREKITVLQALAMAEGLYGNPSKKNARIIRSEPNGASKEIPVNLGKILKGKSPDLEMAANDILFVPISGGKLAMKQATSSAIATISGLIIWRY
jgi:polysaccharide biosynthesis/export protein